MIKLKKFDSVQMVREIREKLHKECQKIPKLQEKRLVEIRKKYGIKAQQ